ncbi:hypothetical protein CDL15_Pgr015632 [Punica granatum]|nr:hypothetical protein CDL15_Pgr015632 [Punica granatum]PKI67180.1 hypothetical protein CRG98_012429 [Punica granatum]
MNIIDEIALAIPTTSTDEVEEVSCECCGLKEDCTKPYILKIKDAHSGRWVCGLCSEAVKERLTKLSPRSAIKEALSSHMEFCLKFNNATRLNPKLSITCAMKEIAKRSLEHRNSGKPPVSNKIYRTTSCVPRIDH